MTVTFSKMGPTSVQVLDSDGAFAVQVTTGAGIVVPCVTVATHAEAMEQAEVARSLFGAEGPVDDQTWRGDIKAIRSDIDGIKEALSLKKGEGTPC